MQDLQFVLFEHIDLRSFSNLWFWIVLAVMWSTASHWNLGVPFDLVARARRNDLQAQRDLEDLVRINVDRMQYILRLAGPWLVGILCFLISALMILGFLYGIEFAQALTFLVLPMSIVAWMRHNTARVITRMQLSGDDLCQLLVRHRFWVQAIGVTSIFVTALWGMFQNLSHSALGG